MNRIKTYFSLTKPGIILGNTLPAAGGFFLASKGHPQWGLFVAMLVGLSYVIASACVFNNYIDREIDSKMARTKKRALVAKLVPLRNAIIYALFLGLVGFLILALYTNFLTMFLAITGFFFYVVMYGIWKRRSIHGTIVGSISGAVPPVVGYCAVTNRFDLGALLLFLILVFWQMPHFYAIAIFRLEDYTAAKIPVLPVKKGITVTRVYMLFYILAFIIATTLLTVFRFTGYLYLGVIVLLGLTWLWYALKGFKTNNNKIWSRKMFAVSLIIILSFSILISIF